MNLILQGDERTQLAQEIRKVTSRVQRQLKHLAELNDERSYAYTRGFDWLADQYAVALDELKSHLRSDFEKIGRLVVRAEEIEAESEC